MAPNTESQAFDPPSWLDHSIFPYQSRRIQIQSHSIHFIDEGSGPTLLLLHGNGSWSFGYRKVIAELSKKFRCIALDYPGFGLSTAGASSNYSYKPREHSAVVEDFVDAMGLSDIRLYVEDWGGPIGLGFAVRRPDLVHSLIITNTWAWPAQGSPNLERFSTVAGGPVGSFLITRFNILGRYMVPWLTIARTMTDAERRGYWAPYPTVESRVPQSIFPREILASKDYLSEVERLLPTLKTKPVLLLWGMKDPGFGDKERERFLGIFPSARVVLLPNAKHYVHIDEPDEVCEALLEFEMAPSALSRTDRIEQ